MPLCCPTNGSTSANVSTEGTDMTGTVLREDWLTSNAIVAFLSAVLMGQSWSTSEGTIKLIFIVTVPDYTSWVILVIIAALFVLSMFFAVATLVPALQTLAFRSGSYLSPGLSFLTWTAFTVTLPSALIQLPSAQWWTILLLVGALFFWGFLLFRCIQQVRQVTNVRGATNAQSNP